MDQASKLIANTLASFQIQPNAQSVIAHAKTLETQDGVLHIMDHCKLVDGYDLVDLGLSIEARYL